MNVIRSDAPVVSMSSSDMALVNTDSLIVVENMTLMLTCSVDAYPAVNMTDVTWHKDGASVGLYA